jgi:PAS domain S-box-containing protein
MSSRAEIRDEKQASLAASMTASPPRSAVPDAALHLAAIVASSDDAIISKDLDGIVTSWNQGAERLFGYTAEEIVGEPVLVLIPVDRHDEEPGILERIRRGDRIEHYETIRQRKDGSHVHVSLTVSPIRNAQGTVVGASKIARDISERKHSEASRELLLNEIKHRVKNTLAAVQAIATQTFRAAPKDERTAFTARLHALADAHDILTQQSWTGGDVREVVTRALAPFQQRDRVRFVVEGPDLRLNPSMTLLLVMVIHELGTNAVKYGALSVETGMVRVEWSLLLDGDRRKLSLRWFESGGPKVKPPGKKGFGTQMIERTLHGEQGSARFDYAVDGLVCNLEVRI